MHALLATALEDALLDVSIIEEVVELDRPKLIGGPLRLVPVVVKLADCDVGDTIQRADDCVNDMLVLGD